MFEVNGPTLSFRGESAREAQPGQRLSPCYPRLCAAGSSVDFSGIKRFGFDSYGDGVLTLGAERFQVSYIAGHFALAGPLTAIPHVVNGFAEVTVPIRVTASLVTYLSSDSQTERSQDLRLVGSGTAQMKLLRPPVSPGAPSSEGWLDDVTLNFGSGGDPAPVPEPGTLMLFATGLGAIGRARIKRRRRK